MGYRMCKVTRKCEDPRMQFFNQFLEKEGWGGLDAEVPEPDRDLKQPMPGDRARKQKTWAPRELEANAEAEDDPSMHFSLADMERDWKELQAKSKVRTGMEAPSMESLAEEMGRSHVGEQLEDDAMAAVRQALESWAI